MEVITLVCLPDGTGRDSEYEHAFTKFKEFYIWKNRDHPKRGDLGLEKKQEAWKGTLPALLTQSVGNASLHARRTDMADAVLVLWLDQHSHLDVPQ